MHPSRRQFLSWITPTITAAMLPAHGQTSSNDNSLLSSSEHECGSTATLFATPGTTTFTVPENTYLLHITAVGGAGGGGSGGSASSTRNLEGLPNPTTAIGGDGGAGASGETIIETVSVTPEQTLVITVGSGGQGGDASSAVLPPSTNRGGAGGAGDPHGQNGSDALGGEGGSGLLSGGGGGAGGTTRIVSENLSIVAQGGAGGGGGGAAFAIDTLNVPSASGIPGQSGSAGGTGGACAGGSHPSLELSGFITGDWCSGEQGGDGGIGHSGDGDSGGTGGAGATSTGGEPILINGIELPYGSREGEAGGKGADGYVEIVCAERH